MRLFEDINKTMNLIVDSQGLIIDDALASLINEYSDDELSEESLMVVSAAAKPSYNSFLESYNI